MLWILLLLFGISDTLVFDSNTDKYGLTVMQLFVYGLYKQQTKKYPKFWDTVIAMLQSELRSTSWIAIDGSIHFLLALKIYINNAYNMTKI